MSPTNEREEQQPISAKRSVRVSELFAGPVREYAIYNNKRMIPSVVDGLKPSQRKVIYGTLKKAPNIDSVTGIKVSQLANYIAEVSAYHHGEGSLSGAIAGMAQNFPGSNNINYLVPIGQFGSRLSKEAGADRYIFTNIANSFRKIFVKEDDLILNYLEDDGDPIEPDFYLPILPNVLINGCDGMATGHATYILQYNPEDLRQYVLARLQNKPVKPLVPWFRGFKGTVKKDQSTGQVVITGKIEKLSSTKLRITELPVGVWQDNYRSILNDLEDIDFIKSSEDRSNVKNWEFDLEVPRTTGFLDEDQLIRSFKLISRATENFTVWLPTGKLKKFTTPEELCDYFIQFRLVKYEERRQAMLKKLKEQLFEQNERLRFIRYYINNAVKFSKKTKLEMSQILLDEGFTLLEKLLDIRIYNLTQDQIEKLEKDIKETEAEIIHYEKATAHSLYLEELNKLDLRDELKDPYENLVVKKGRKK
jgi:DNA topoisomerase-2